MSMKSNAKINQKFVRDFNRGVVRSMFASVFAAVITDKKRDGEFTYAELAKQLGVGKSVVSRWFNRDVNWEVNSLADIAAALNVDLTITAKDHRTGKIYGPAGVFPMAVHTSTPQGQAPSGTTPSTHSRATPVAVIAA